MCAAKRPRQHVIARKEHLIAVWSLPPEVQVEGLGFALVKLVRALGGSFDGKVLTLQATLRVIAFDSVMLKGLESH